MVQSLSSVIGLDPFFAWIPTEIVFILCLWLTNLDILRLCWDFKLKIFCKTYFVWTTFCEKNFQDFRKFCENSQKYISSFAKIYPLKVFWTGFSQKLISQKKIIYFVIIIIIIIFLYFSFFQAHNFFRLGLIEMSYYWMDFTRLMAGKP